VLKTSLATVLLLALAAPTLAAPAAPAAPAAAPAQSEDARFSAFLQETFQQGLELSPQTMTQLGMKTRYGELDDASDAAALRNIELSRAQLARMKRDFVYERLSPANQLNWRLFEDQVKNGETFYKWRWNFYQVSTEGSPTTSLPVFLINNHRVDTVADAEAYVSRLAAVGRVLEQTSDTLEAQQKMGVLAPSYVYAPVLDSSRAVLKGAPFTDGADTPLWADFKTKVGALKADDATKARLLDQGRAAMTGPMRKGYDRILGVLEAQSKLANSTDGVWRLPNGDAFYNATLGFFTTTDLTADQIHKTGLGEVARIRKEMEGIKDKVGFKGDLNAFLGFVKTDPKFHYTNDDAGRAAYLADANRIISDYMKDGAPQQFSVLPKAPVQVKAVEAWRTETASVAFYNPGTPDGSRPGIFYINLGDPSQVLRPMVEATTCHEAAPGHHFQIARSQEQQDLPMFRRFAFYGAYIEGWGLYAERLCKEAGMYQDPYSDLGRLSLELWRAARLVVDTGLHSKRWSRDQALQYFRENTMLSERDLTKEVNRYIANPGQATSYKIGQLKILALRDKARAALGPRFDLKEFHEVVLSNGALPLGVLEQQVDAWIARKK
jgi:uncharacterized protein (DUF885 family)